jgi:acyl dehydratase
MMPDGVDYGINIGFERVRFLAPVPVDSAIRMKATALACEPRGPGRWTFKCRCNIEVRETARVALSAIWTVLFINTAKSALAAAGAEASAEKA